MDTVSNARRIARSIRVRRRQRQVRSIRLLVIGIAACGADIQRSARGVARRADLEVLLIALTRRGAEKKTERSEGAVGKIERPEGRLTRTPDDHGLARMIDRHRP